MTFPATTEGLAQCQAFLSSICEDPKPQIIMDEVVSNIVRCSGASEFSVDYRRSDAGQVTMTFTDDGLAFDPTTVPEPDITATAADRQIGGLGMLMVRRMSERVEYAREGNRNSLTVVLKA